MLIPHFLLLYWEEWQSRFEKEMDIWFVMHPGDISPRFTHEPLLVGLSFPMYRSYPWLLRLESEKVVEIGRTLSALSKTSHVRVRNYLRNYGVSRLRFPKCTGAWCASCFTAHDLDCFEVKLPRDFNGASLAEVDDELRFKTARAGDHICTSFQCPNCQSQNIRGVDLDPRSARDQAFEALAIRATLDAFWSSSSPTVAAHVTNVRFMRRYGESLGFLPMPALGPFPLYKHNGMLEAIVLLLRSTEPGKKKATVLDSAKG